jgi:hypothetical protein
MQKHARMLDQLEAALETKHKLLADAAKGQDGSYPYRTVRISPGADVVRDKVLS